MHFGSRPGPNHRGVDFHRANRFDDDDGSVADDVNDTATPGDRHIDDHHHADR
jgi:hypothetical protein